jgi:hypothetical protein
MSPQSIKRYIKLHNQNDQIIILMSKILMQPRLNNDQNSDVENFDTSSRIRTTNLDVRNFDAAYI